MNRADDIDTRALRARIPETALELCRRLNEAGFKSWVVGGCVRDVLRSSLAGSSNDRAATDWDIATEAHPARVSRLFRRVIPTGVEHGTVTVLIGDASYEVTTLRGEGTYSDGRRPDAVHFVSDIVEDLARRDFTINAVAYDPLEDRLLDPFGGLADMERGVLRAVGNPHERFNEDGLRVLRAARFVATLEVEIDTETARAIRPSLETYRKVSPERIRDEWLKTMKARAPSRAFRVMQEHGMLEITAPELVESVGCEQNRFHAFDVWNHALSCLDNCPPAPLLRLSGLLHDVGKPRTRAFSEKTQDYTFYEHERVGAEMVEPMLLRLRFSNDERARIGALVRHHLICYDESWSDSAVRRWVRRVSPELLEDLYQLNAADVSAKGRDAADDLLRLEALKERVGKVLAEGAALSIRDLDIDGHVLMRELAVKPGPLLGELLRALLELVIDAPELNQHDTLLDRARQLLPELQAQMQRR